MKNINIYIVFITIILIGCSNVGLPAITDNTNSIWQLAKGNYWKMANISHISNKRDTTAMYCLRDTLFEGASWWVMSPDGISNSVDGVTALYKNKEDGLHVTLFAGTLKVESLWFKYPTKIGDEYNVSFDYKDTTKYLVESIDTVINIGNKQYKNVIKYTNIRISGKYPYVSTDYNYYYLCPGIGMIKTEIYSQLLGYDKKFYLESELYDYKLN